MGIKVKLLFIFLISASYGFSQKAKQKPTDDKLYNLKGYSLNYCLYNNYSRLNSDRVAEFNDFSSRMFKDILKLDDNKENSLQNFIIKKTSSYYKEGSSYYSEKGVPNLIFYQCYNFYNSQELKIFLEKLLNEKG